MTFEIPQDLGGITEKDGEFFVSDPSVLATLEAKERALEEEIKSLEVKIADIVRELTEEEGMNERLLDLFTKMLDQSLEKVKVLQEMRDGTPTLH